jgi:tetratricopeptide (TPR) repeat protein
MKMHLLAAMVGSALALSAAPGTADDGDSQTGKLGKVTFPTSCDPKLQAEFERAVAMLHSFWYASAERAFPDLAARDPSCAIAHWGYASILMNNPLAGTGATPAAAKKAQVAIDEARRIGAKTQRERDYIEATAAYYEDYANRPEKARQAARAKAYEALAARYPDDDEAQIFAALYIAGTQSQADQTFAAYLKAAGMLEPQFKKHPDHPGIAHYLIHSYDAPPIADKGLDAARRYASIAPAAPHALHMPSHIFTRVGAWEESAETNLRSAKVAKSGGEADETYHASDYAVYAYLQLARDSAAHDVIMDTLKVTGVSTGRPTAFYAAAAMQARYAVERGDWKAAMQLQPAATSYPFTDAITHFARAMGALRSGDLAAADQDAQALTALHKKLVDAKNTYWATEVEVQRLTVAGWTLHAKGMSADGLKLMRAAADLEDRNEKHIVTPARIVPARELLAEMLLEQKQPALALKEFEASQLREPNRFRNFAGAAQAAEMAGDRAKAAQYAKKLLDLAAKGDGKRPEVAMAKAVLAQR